MNDSITMRTMLLVTTTKRFLRCFSSKTHSNSNTIFPTSKKDWRIQEIAKELTNLAWRLFVRKIMVILCGRCQAYGRACVSRKSQTDVTTAFRRLKTRADQLQTWRTLHKTSSIHLYRTRIHWGIIIFWARAQKKTKHDFSVDGKRSAQHQTNDSNEWSVCFPSWSPQMVVKIDCR